MAVISNNLIGPRPHPAKAGQAETKPVEEADPPQADDQIFAMEADRFEQSTDEMSAAITEFRNRRDYDRNNRLQNRSFERVLEEDVLPKSLRVLDLAQLDDLSLADFLRQAALLFPDESDLILVLRELLQRYKFDEVKKKRIQEAIKQVEAEANPRTLKAGINCALKARLFGKMLALNPVFLRATYRQFIESDVNEIAVYEEWIASYGYQHRGVILDFVEGVLLTDIDSHDPSCSHMEFGNLFGRLTQLKLLRSAEQIFVQHLITHPLIIEYNHKEADWLVFMLAVLQAPNELDALLLDILGEAVFLTSHTKRSALLQVIRQACQSLPLALFVDPEPMSALLEKFEHLASVAYNNELIEQRRNRYRK